MHIRHLFSLRILAKAALGLVILTSCQSGGGGAGSAAHGPAYDAAVKNLTSQIEGVSVKAQWVTATRTNSGFANSHAYVNVSDCITNLQIRYSNSRVTPDGVFHVFESGKTWNSITPTCVADLAYTTQIPLHKVSRVFVHNHEHSPEWEALFLAESNKTLGIVELNPAQSLYQNMTGTWTVELVQGSGKKSTDYVRFYFPSRQKAEAFASAWRNLAAIR